MAILEVDGQKLKVLNCSYRFTEATDSTGMPISIPRGGIIKMGVESTRSSLLFNWMISPLQTKSGKVTFFRVKDSSRILEVLEFTDAYCVDYYETFNHTGNDPMQIQLKISAGKLKLNGSEYPTGGNEEAIIEGELVVVHETYNRVAEPVVNENETGSNLPVLMKNDEEAEKDKEEQDPEAKNNLTAKDFYENPQLIWGLTHKQLETILFKEGWKAKPYEGTSTAYEYIFDSKAGRKSIVVNYGGGRHTHETGKTVYQEPFYYKITGGGNPRTKVVNEATYPADELEAESSRFIDGLTGKILK